MSEHSISSTNANSKMLFTWEWTTNDSSSICGSTNSSSNELGMRCPFLKRNIQCRYRKLEKKRVIQEESHRTKYLSASVPDTSVVHSATTTESSRHHNNVITWKKTPFLKRNLCIERTMTLMERRKSGTRNYYTSDSVKQYRVHCVKKERTVKVNTIVASFLCPSFQCPFCDGIIQCTDFKRLWLHCMLIHGDQNMFHPIQTTDRQLHLVVEPQLLPVVPNNPDAGVRRYNKTNLLFDRKSPSESNMKLIPSFHKALREHVPLPIRAYYHDVTFHPMSLTEWLCRNAKDDVCDPLWRRIVGTSALYELTDVTSKEKLFMALWNEHMRQNPLTLVINLPSQLESFVQIQSISILEHQLQDEFILHLTNMWHEGHINRETMLDSMKLYRSLAERDVCKPHHRIH